MVETKNKETPIEPRSAKTPVEGNIIIPSKMLELRNILRLDEASISDLQLMPSRILIKVPSKTAGIADNTILDLTGISCNVFLTTFFQAGIPS